MVVQPPKWFDDDADNTPWLKALEDVRRKATREGHCYQSNHRGHRPIRRSGYRQSALFFEQAAENWVTTHERFSCHMRCGFAHDWRQNVPYWIHAKIKGGAVSVVVDTAKEALAKIEELSISDHVEVLAKDLSGKILDRATLQVEASQSL